jgi:hypothetical protein
MPRQQFGTESRARSVGDAAQSLPPLSLIASAPGTSSPPPTSSRQAFATSIVVQRVDASTIERVLTNRSRIRGWNLLSKVDR